MRSRARSTPDYESSTNDSFGSSAFALDSASSFLSRSTVDLAHAKPFLKWVGGKRQLLDSLRTYKPSTFRRYHEPFVGGGALFFALAPSQAYLSDRNERLIRSYIGIRDHVDQVISLLRSYPHEKTFFETMRASNVDAGSDAEVAAWMIYLNHTAYNGLYRVNKSNRFNVPFGNYKNPTICDEQRLRACSVSLRGAELDCNDFTRVVDRAKRGDFVYFDPPYVPLSTSSSFTNYTAGGFDMSRQIELRDVARALKKKGVHVLLSNSSADEVRRLYARGFDVVEVGATRAVNSRADRRGKVVELLIR
ncbi:MAG: DNA adenine methylase [Polyangiaceae bacterium]